MNNPYANPYAPAPFAPGLAGAPGGMAGAMAGPGMATPAGGAMPMGAGGMTGAGQLDPALVQQILALQSQQGQRAQVQRATELAGQLRADAQQRSSTKYNPRVGVANVADQALAGYAARQMMDRAEQRESALDTGRQAAAARFFDALRGQRTTME